MYGEWAAQGRGGHGCKTSSSPTGIVCVTERRRQESGWWNGMWAATRESCPLMIRKRNVERGNVHGEGRSEAQQETTSSADQSIDAGKVFDVMKFTVETRFSV